MTRLLRLALLLAFLVAVGILVGGTPTRPMAAAEPAPLPVELQIVPPDAAVFTHIDFATLWTSKIGDSFRAAKPKELEKLLGQLKEKFGLSPDMVKTVTVFFPQVKGPGDESTFAVQLTLSKPYEKTLILESLKKDKIVYSENPDGTYTADVEGTGKADRPKVTLVMSDKYKIGYFSHLDAKHRKPATGTGPQTAAIRAAANGATATLGLNFAHFPDEFRGDALPAEARPFQPLLMADAAYLTGKLTGDTVAFDLRFRGADKAKTADAEKSLAAGVTLLQGLLGLADMQLGKSDDEVEKKVRPFVADLIAGLKAVRVSADDTEALASGTLKADTNFGPSLIQLFGGPSASPAGARAQTTNNLKQIGLALHNYHDVYDGFPPAAVCDKKGRPLLSWRVLILPFVEQDHIYKQFNLDEAWDSEHNKKVFEKNPMPKVFEFVGVTKEGSKDTHFKVFTGNGALFDGLLKTKIQSITDGTSNTIMVGTATTASPWSKPDDIEFDPKTFTKKMLHFGDKKTYIGMADGSVRAVSETVTDELLKASITKNGGEVIGEIP